MATSKLGSIISSHSKESKAPLSANSVTSKSRSGASQAPSTAISSRKDPSSRTSAKNHSHTRTSEPTSVASSTLNGSKKSTTLSMPNSLHSAPNSPSSNPLSNFDSNNKKPASIVNSVVRGAIRSPISPKPVMSAKTVNSTALDEPPTIEMHGAKNPDQDCDMITALDEDALSLVEFQFLEAARTNRCDIIAAILERKKFNVNVRTNLDRTALHMAASQGHIQAVQMLVKGKATVDVVDKHGMTPLMWATHNDRLEVVLYLLNQGASPFRRSKRGYSLLHIMAKGDAVKTMEVLLRNKTITQFTDLDNNEATPLIIAASSGSVRATTVLSRLGTIGEHIEKTSGKNLFHLAVEAHSPDTLQVLCENESAPHFMNNFDFDLMAPLHYAVKDSDYDCVEVLLRNGANPNVNSRKASCPIITAAQKGDIEMIDLLVHFKARLRVVNFSGNTALHISSIANSVETSRELLYMGAKLEARNKRLQTPLCAAVEQGSAEVAELLLLAGADTKKFDRSAKTPLFMAAQCGFIRIVDLLIKTERWRIACPDMASKIQSRFKGEEDMMSDEDSISLAETYNSSSPDSEMQEQLKTLSNFEENLITESSGPEESDDASNRQNSISISEVSTYHSSDSDGQSKPKSMITVDHSTSHDQQSKSSLLTPTLLTVDGTTGGANTTLQEPSEDGVHFVHQKISEVSHRVPKMVNRSIAESKEQLRDFLHDSPSTTHLSSQHTKTAENSYDSVSIKSGESFEVSSNDSDRQALAIAQLAKVDPTDYECALDQNIFKQDEEQAYVGSVSENGSEYDFRLLTFNQAYANKFQMLLYYLSHNKLKKDDWKKLAVYWKFSQEQIEAIAMHHTDDSSAYQDHGFRTLSIWLHGLGAEAIPANELYSAMVAIGQKRRADKMQKYYHKSLSGKSNKLDNCRVS